MNTILNFAEHELENGIYKELEPILKVLLHRVIHREVDKLSKRQVNNGVWSPYPVVCPPKCGQCLSTNTSIV